MPIHGLFKEPIIGPLKFKMAEIRHLKIVFLPITRHQIVRFELNFAQGSKIAW